MSVKNKIRIIANALGVDIVRLHQAPKKSLLGLRSRNIGSIIDCGANEGQFAQLMAKVFPNAKFYCFEPLEAPFNKLKDWADTQNGRVHCFNLALGNEEGEIEMHRHDSHTPSSSILAATAHCHQIYPQTISKSKANVRLTKLDKALQDSLSGMQGEILLKLDVQGFEDRVLRGATRVLAACSACILEVCLDPLYEGQADFFELARLLKDSGYRYAGNLEQVYAADGRIVFLDAVFLK